MNNPLFFSTVQSLYTLDTIHSSHSVAGGLQHRLFRLETANGIWALKILSPRSAATQEGRKRLERAETVAKMALDVGIPAMTATRGPDGAFLQRVENDWILLYRWTDGTTLPPTAASTIQAEVMGSHLGKLHTLAIRFPDQESPHPEAFSDDHWPALARRGTASNAIWTEAVNRNLERLVEANSRAMKSQLALQEGWVTGHLDFDQKNVLWNCEKPTILDWEAAKPIHPALELMGAGLSWAGQSAGDAKAEVFKAFLSGYRSQTSVSTEDLLTACDAVLGKWLIWLEFNLQRSLEPAIRGTDEERITHDALFHALGATLKLQDDIPIYRNWCEEVF